MYKFYISVVKFYFLLCIPVMSFVLSCASSPKLNAEDGSAKGVYDISQSERSAISPELENKKKNTKYTYFSDIPSGIMAEIENGSPASLRNAASNLRKSEIEYKENEKVLLVVASSIMKICWSTEVASWESPAVTDDTPYLGAINSAKNGIYDTSTGNVDFLTILLPSLVILKTEDVSAFFDLSYYSLNSALQLRPDSVLANYLMGMLLKKKGDYSQALKYLSKASLDSPESLQTSYANAECKYLMKDYADAEIELELLVKKYSLNTQVLKLAAKNSYELKNYENAQEYIARVLQQNPNDLDSLLFRARVLTAKKDYIHAASLLDVYSRQDNSSKQYLLLRAEIQIEWSKNLSAAVSTIEKALSLYPDDVEVLLFAAKLSAMSSHPVLGKEASYYAMRVIEKNSLNETAFIYAIEGFVQTENWTKAYELSSSLVKKTDVSEEIYSTHIKICLSIKKYEEAFLLASRLYKANPASDAVVQSYITVLIATDRTGQALELINRLLTSASAKMKSFLFYSRSLIQNSESEALSDLRSSLISNPRNTDALFRLYEIYYKKGDYKRAQYYLKQVVSLKPNDASVKSLNDKLSEKIK